MNARTHDEVFQDWKTKNEERQRWKSYNIAAFDVLLTYYERMGFRVIPLGKKSKRPIPNFDWDGEKMPRLELFGHLCAGGNLGIVAGLSDPKLVIIDWDSVEIPEQVMALKTPISISPNGYHIVFQGQFNEKLMDRFAKKYQYAFPRGGPKARAGIGYAVIPPSETCKQEHSDHPCEAEGKPHDYRMHEWLSARQTLLPFSILKTLI